MGARVEVASAEEVRITAPLDPNLNHRNTAFGGSLAALSILAGWCVVHLGLREEGLRVRTVIQASRTAFTRPARGTFQAIAARPDPRAWARLLRSLERWGRGRVPVAVRLTDADGLPVGSMEADYVALVGGEEPASA